MFVWLLLWSFWALPRGLELELGTESLGPNRGRGGNNQHGKSVLTERQRRMMRWRTEAGVEGKQNEAKSQEQGGNRLEAGPGTGWDGQGRGAGLLGPKAFTYICVGSGLAWALEPRDEEGGG